MSEDLAALAGTVARIHSIYDDVEEFVNLAKDERAEVVNLAMSSNRVVVRWPNGYQVTIVIILPDVKANILRTLVSEVEVRIDAAICRNGFTTSLRPYPSLKAALAERHR